MDASSDLPSPFIRRNSRHSVMRSHTFNTPPTNVLKLSSDELKSNENLTCQSTPELSRSNERERNESNVNLDGNSGLSTSSTILTSTSLTGLTPTSSGTVDDKNEVCTCSFFFLLLYHDIQLAEEEEEIITDRR